ncbi:hypothetical protein KIN20_011183 [Parelaphostrongylus tenuis]|uniref:Uncharacterized protein n=1 Tax=Parelaphostrongylus tenuis TaxID=148309 RepID=A0AAD5M910_PARTN|nr:hypothetical protein KIN20_011183 [Parelaphostrongylus tenuis]
MDGFRFTINDMEILRLVANQGDPRSRKIAHTEVLEGDKRRGVSILVTNVLKL